MARKAMIVKNNRRREMALKYKAHRDELRKKSVDMKLSPEEREDAILKLQKLPRDTSFSRIRNRCALTGRARGHLRKFGLCRISVRELASHGKLPGVIKASW